MLKPINRTSQLFTGLFAMLITLFSFILLSAQILSVSIIWMIIRFSSPGAHKNAQIISYQLKQ